MSERRDKRRKKKAGKVHGRRESRVKKRRGGSTQLGLGGNIIKVAPYSKRRGKKKGLLRLP